MELRSGSESSDQAFASAMASGERGADSLTPNMSHEGSTSSAFAIEPMILGRRLFPFSIF